MTISPSDAALRRLGWTICAMTVLSAPITVAPFASAGRLGEFVDGYGATNTLVGLCYGLVGLVLIKAEPRNRLVWLFVALGFCVAVPGVFNAVHELLARSQGVDADVLDTDRISPGLVLALKWGYSLWVIGAFGLPTLGLLLAPDGHLLSPRWRIVAGGSLISIGSLYVAFASYWPLRDNQPPDGTWRTSVIALGFPVVLALILASFGSLLLRYRRADGVVRRQLRWVLLGSALVAIGGVGSFAGAWVPLIFIPLFALCYGMAIWRDQLFDVDVVISRTLIYASTLAVITSVYVAIVFGLGSLFGRDADGPTALPILATAVIALIFHPARTRLERLANRLVFGRRATPYEVLSDFTQRVAATDANLLDDVARNLAGGTAATAVSVWSLDDGMLRPVSLWPSSPDVLPTPAIVDATTGHHLAPAATYTHPIGHEGRTIGLLGLTLPAGEELTTGDQRLISDLVNGIGLALWNRRLTARFRASIDDLQASRRRLVAAQDDVRHKLERDLHDGAQQRLVAIKVRLSIAQQICEKQGADHTAAALGVLCGRADETIESLRDFARGVYPPLLEAEGLAAAVEAQLARSTLPATFTAAIDRRHGRDVEATAYFAVLETLAALDGASRPSSIAVDLEEDDAHAKLTIRIEHASEQPVAPPTHVVDRVEAVAGTIETQWGPDDRAAIITIRLPIDSIDATPGLVLTGTELVPA